MRILFYSNSSTTYGAPSSLMNLVSGINQDVELKIVLPSHGKLVEKLEEAKISYIVIPYFRWIYNYRIFMRKKERSGILAYLWLLKNVIMRAFKNLFFLPKHITHCRAFGPDIIYVNSSISPVGGVLGWITRIPIVWHHRETLNDPIVEFFMDFGPGLSSKIFLTSKVHIFPSLYLKDAYIWLKKRKKDIIQFNGVFFKDEILGVIPRNLDAENIRFGMVGRVCEQKGQREVIEVFNLLNYKKLSLHLFGDGNETYTTELREQVKNENVVFEGFQAAEKIYNEIDLVIINAKNESFGRVVAEANAFGIPVLAVDSGALGELIVDDVNGYKYENQEQLKRLKERFDLNNCSYYASSNYMSYTVVKL